jgi:hypothetical protein
MTEEILKVKAEELTTIRLVFAGGVVHEMPLGEVKSYAVAASTPQVHQALLALAKGLEYFSTKGVEPSVEFVVPVKR